MGIPIKVHLTELDKDLDMITNWKQIRFQNPAVKEYNAQGSESGTGPELDPYSLSCWIRIQILYKDTDQGVLRRI